MLARTSSRVGRMGQKAPVETARLTGREPDEAMSSSESLSEEVGDNSGVVDGEKFRKDGAKDLFFSIAKSRRRGAWNFGRFLTGPPLIACAGASVDRREIGLLGRELRRREHERGSGCRKRKQVEREGERVLRRMK